MTTKKEVYYYILGLFYVMCMCTKYMPGAFRGLRRASDSSGTGVMDGREIPCERWKLSMIPLQEQ